MKLAQQVINLVEDQKHNVALIDGYSIEQTTYSGNGSFASFSRKTTKGILFIITNLETGKKFEKYDKTSFNDWLKKKGVKPQDLDWGGTKNNEAKSVSRDLTASDSYKLFDYFVSYKVVPALPKHGMRQSITNTKEYEIIRVSDNKRFTIVGAVKYKKWESDKLKEGKTIKIGDDEVKLPKQKNESKSVSKDGEKSYVYKGHKLNLVEAPNGYDKWYTVWKDDVKVNQDRDLNTLAKAKKFVDGIK